LTKKVKMYGGYIDSLRTNPEFILIAETYSFETKRQDHFRSKIESEKTFATSPADTEQTSNKGKITNRKASFFMGASKKLSSLWGI
jgi:hypothetical protein